MMTSEAVEASREHKLITCILPLGRSAAVVRALSRDRGIDATHVSYARGVGRITPLTHRGVGETTEKEILTVVVDAADADGVFEFIYDEAGVNQPHGGLMFMHPLTLATLFRLPDLPEEV